MKSVISRRLFLLFIGLITGLMSLLAQNTAQQVQKWNLDSSRSEISYTGVHLLHEWKGVNKKLVGLMQTKEEQLEIIAVSAKVADFDSGNENRDAHALELLDVFDFPNVRFLAKKFIYDGQKVVMDGVLQFRGVNRDISVTMNIEKVENQYKVFGDFNIQPTLFNMPLPSFMLKDIDDVLDISVSLIFIPTES